MSAQKTIEAWIADGKLPEAFSSFHEFLKECEELREALTQCQSRYSSLQRDIIHNTTASETGNIEYSRITLSIINQLANFRREVLPRYFEVSSFEQALNQLPSRDDLIRKALDLRLQPKSYQVDKLLAEGNSSAVYSVKNLAIDRLVVCMALKISSLDDEAKEQISRLVYFKHRNIIGMLDYELEVYPYFIILEYVHGPTLKEAIDKTGARPAAQVVDWLYQLSDATAYLRNKRIQHTNLRASKIYVDEEWQIMISPLDLFVISDGGKSSSRYLDLCRYSSPEFLQQADKKQTEDIDLALSDQYAIGLLGYKMLTGQELFEGESIYEVLENRRRFVTDPVYRLERLQLMPTEAFLGRDGQRQTLTDIIHRLLQENPADRFPTLHDLLRALHDLTRAENPDISPARKSYRRALARNREFIRDFYAAFHETLPQSRAYFKDTDNKRQSAMLQMAIDVLLDIDREEERLRAIIEGKHQGYSPEEFEIFIDTLLATVKQNDWAWDDATAAEWTRIRDKAISVVRARSAEVLPQ